jgi:hypothetical protein
VALVGWNTSIQAHVRNARQMLPQQIMLDNVKHGYKKELIIKSP